MSVPAELPGESVPPLRATSPTMPLPPSVAPGLTHAEPRPNEREPLTKSVPALTVVPPIEGCLTRERQRAARFFHEAAVPAMLPAKLPELTVSMVEEAVPVLTVPSPNSALMPPVAR